MMFLAETIDGASATATNGWDALTILSVLVLVGFVVWRVTR